MLNIERLMAAFALSFAALSAPIEALAPAAQQDSNQTETVTFTPPPGWKLAELKGLPPSIKAMVIGKGQHEYPPSINLAVESWEGSLKDYVKLAKNISEARGADFKDLGMIKTEAGDAALVQEDSKTQWGEERQMHVILLKNGMIYTLTAASLKEEFPKFYKDFFASMRSLRVSKGVFDRIADKGRREKLEIAVKDLKNAFQAILNKQKALNDGKTDSKQSPQEVFESGEFQKGFWEPFKAFVAKDYSDLNQEWQQLLLAQVQTSLLMESR